MIKKEELLRISKIAGMKPHQQEKHYIQTVVLRSIYSEFNPAFKGGTALMFVHGLNRFSDDLDFTDPKIPGVKTVLKTVNDDLEYLGIRARTRVLSDKGIGLSFKISAEGPLYTNEIERCHVAVEISKREDIRMESKTVFIDPNYPDVLPFAVRIMDIKEIMAEKIRAAITRNRARDVYDLWFLVNRGISTEICLVNEKMKYYRRIFKLEEFKQGLEKKRGIWKSELSPVIFGPLPNFDDVEKQLIVSSDDWSD